MKRLSLSMIALSIATHSFAADQKMIWGTPSKLNMPLQQSTPFTNHGILKAIATSKSVYSLKTLEDNDIHAHHIRYQQFYKDVPIWGHQIIFHKNQKGTPSITGIEATNIEQDVANTDAQLSEKEVTDHWVKDDENNIKFLKVNKIIFLDKDNKAHLAYHLSYYISRDDKPFSQPNFIVDANKQILYKKWEGMHHQNIGQGLGGNSVPLPFRDGMFQYGKALPNLKSLGKINVTEQDGQCVYENDDVRVVSLLNIELGYDAFPIMPIIETMLGLEPFSYACSADSQYINYSDGLDGPVNHAFSPNNDVMFFAQKTLDMYKNIYHVSKPIGDDLPLTIYTHLGKMDNAFAIPTIDIDGSILAHQQVVVGNGDQFLTSPSQLVIAHELSHNFTEVNSQLIYEGQSGAINEAFSDMAAMALNAELRKKYDWFWDGEDWSIGREATLSGEPLRFMDDPTKDGMSIGHADDYEDGMNVHFSSGVFNKAFYLLANKPDYDIEKAFQLMVDANRHYWSPIAYYDFAACGVLQAAKDNKFDVEQAIEAFDEVGVHCPMKMR